MKRSVAILGLVGLVGCFLPLVDGVSLFDLRHLDPWPVYFVLAAFAAPMIAGARSKMTSLHSIIAVGGFGYVLYKFGTGVVDLIIHAQIGGRMMGIAAVVGFVAALYALVETAATTST
jgi:hypothetical protein